MTTHRPYSRMICIRLSEEQYQALQHVCLANGPRRLSTFAREAMDARLNQLNEEHEQYHFSNQLEAHLTRLDQKIDELREMLASLK